MNLPNVLSMIRIAMIPVVAILFSRGEFRAAAMVFLLACLTDILDGYLARRFGWITDVGKLLDPLADKGMQLTVLISLAGCGRMPQTVVWLVFGKECFMFLGGLFLYKKHVVEGANWYGKIATVLVSVCVMTVLLFYDIMSPALLLIVQWLPVLAAGVSFTMYFIRFLKNVKDKQLL